MDEIHIEPADAIEGGRIPVPRNTRAISVNVRIDGDRLELFPVEIVVGMPPHERVAGSGTMDRRARRFPIEGGADDFVRVRFPKGFSIRQVTAWLDVAPKSN
jgi:hypothetical protein